MTDISYMSEILSHPFLSLNQTHIKDHSIPTNHAKQPQDIDNLIPLGSVWLLGS